MRSRWGGGMASPDRQRISHDWLVPCCFRMEIQACLPLVLILGGDKRARGLQLGLQEIGHINASQDLHALLFRVYNRYAKDAADGSQTRGPSQPRNIYSSIWGLQPCEWFQEKLNRAHSDSYLDICDYLVGLYLHLWLPQVPVSAELILREAESTADAAKRLGKLTWS